LNLASNRLTSTSASASAGASADVSGIGNADVGPAAAAAAAGGGDVDTGSSCGPSNFDLRGVAVLAHGVASIAPTLTALNLSGTDLRCEGVIAVCEALTTGALLMAGHVSPRPSLRLQEGEGKWTGAAGWCHSNFNSPSPLTDLNLARNGFGDRGTRALADALRLLYY
jgi:hypothetical protein